MNHMDLREEILRLQEENKRLRKEIERLRASCTGFCLCEYLSRG